MDKEDVKPQVILFLLSGITRNLAAIFPIAETKYNLLIFLIYHYKTHRTCLISTKKNQQETLYKQYRAMPHSSQHTANYRNDTKENRVIDRYKTACLKTELQSRRTTESPSIIPRD